MIDAAHSAPHVDDFLQAILHKYPNSTHWLTTHNQVELQRAKTALRLQLKPETLALLDKIKLLAWRELKTDAIDFEQDFLWFDDDLWPEELNALEKHEAVERFIMVDLEKDPDMLQKLTQVILSFPA